MIKQLGILITRNTFHINDTRRFKSVHFQDIKSNFVSQAIRETPRAMSKKYTRISKSHIVKRIVETMKVEQCYFHGELQPDSLVFRKLPYSRDVYFAEVNA